MKVTVDNKEKDSAKPFPKLMISGSGQIVLFSTLKCGTKINKDDNCRTLGHYSESWEMLAFKDFTGTLTLEND